MKLYATTTSERASKGQGGNEYIEVEVLNEQKRRIHILHIIPRGDDNLFIINHNDAYIQKSRGGGYNVDIREALTALQHAKEKGKK